MGTFKLKYALLFVAACSLYACSTPPEGDDNVFVVSASLNGTQERPTPVSTPATGSLRGSYNNITNRLAYTISWSNLKANPFAMHFHGPAGPEEVAPPVIGLMNFPASTSATFGGNATLTEEQEMQLLQGKWYLNIHTPVHPGGEIRGQVLATN